MKKPRISRRDFVRNASALASGLAVAPVVQNVLGANDKIVLGVIGPGGPPFARGKRVMQSFVRLGAEVAAVCDVYRPYADEACADSGCKPEVYNDYRKLLERKDIDAVIIGTPDHWHALPTVHACQAGKHVYVEKPLATSIGEGRRMVEAARKYNRLVQAGTQHRSGPHFKRVEQLVQSGVLGEISQVRAWNMGNSYPAGIGCPPDSDPPPGLDWDAWLGPAAKVPYNPNRFLRGNFRWFWDYAGGLMTDWGVHWIDTIHQCMHVEAPRSVCASGGKFALQDNRETPDTLEVIYEYPGWILVYSISQCVSRGIDAKGGGFQFYGTDATLYADRSQYELFPREIRKGTVDEGVFSYNTAPIRGRGQDQETPHIRNFIEAVRGQATLNADVEVCHRSTTAAILGNIALKTGRKLHWDAAKEEFINDIEANKHLMKEYRAPYNLEKI
jgi:predicted dehydrogenase